MIRTNEELLIGLRRILFILAILLASLGVGFSVWDVTSANPVFQYSTYIIYLWGVLGVVGSGRSLKPYQFRLLSCIVILGTVLLILYGSIYSYQLIILIASFFFVLECFKNQADKISCLLFLINGCVFSVVLIASWYFQTPKLWYGRAYTIGAFNPQGIGVWAFLFSCALILTMDFFNKALVKVICYIGLYMLFTITMAARARGSQVAIIVLLIFHLLPQIELLKKRWIAYFIPLVPLLIFILSELFWFLGAFRGMSGGTLLNGREVHWLEYFNVIIENPLWGNKNYADKYTHNIFLQHALCFGFPVAIIYIVSITRALLNILPGIQSRLQYDALIAFMAVMLQASQENSVLSIGVGGAYLYALSILLLTTYNPENDEKLDRNRKISIKMPKIRIKI